MAARGHRPLQFVQELAPAQIRNALGQAAVFLHEAQLARGLLVAPAAGLAPGHVLAPEAQEAGTPLEVTDPPQIPMHVGHGLFLQAHVQAFDRRKTGQGVEGQGFPATPSLSKRRCRAQRAWPGAHTNETCQLPSALRANVTSLGGVAGQA